VVADFTLVAETYLNVRPAYEELAEQLADRLQGHLNDLGVPVVVHYRAKTVLSFAKKALRKGYHDPMAEVGDLAGVRIIVDFLADVQPVETAVEELCIVVARESKVDAMSYNQLGYLGVHLEVTPKPNAVHIPGGQADVMRAEIQIHTRAQSAWAVVSHDLLYKAPHELSDEIKRGVTRLVALVEIFDAEIARFRRTIEQDPDHAELALLEPLDDEIIRFTARRPDRALSAVIVPPLVRLYNSSVTEILTQQITPFLIENNSRLQTLFAAYRDDERANPLLLQPEALLIFHLLGRDPDRLREAWPSNLIPFELLEALATVWGTEL
jgi:ppGpp synthetase/RelA/SpoT-type nucleotidyltranferase